MNQVNNTNVKISLFETISYGMGSLGNNIIYSFVTTYLIVYYTDYFGLAAGAIGVMVIITKIWDAVNDSLMGIIVDNTNTRFGKFRPYLLFVPFMLAASTIACFLSPNFSTTGKLIYAYITYIAWDMSFTAMDIPYWSMSAAITQDPEERTKVVAVPRTFAIVGILIANVATLPLVKLFGGWQYVAVLYGIFAIIFTLITFFNVKERVHVPREKSQTIKDVFHLLKENRPLTFVLLNMLVFETVNSLRLILVVYYCKYNFNSEDLVPIFLGLYLLVSLLGAVLSPFISKWLGKKQTVMWGTIITGIAAIGMYFTGYHSFIPIIIWSAIGGFTAGFAGIAQTSMVADCVEYGEWKTGNRAEGMVFSTNIFKTKVASAIGGSVGAFALASIGFVANTTQSKFTLDWLHIFLTLIPGVLSLIALIPLKFYDLSEDKYKSILSEIGKDKGASI
jgi:GPH family glycoside/pentoside/hexuronide:cation symporter/probable glucitol transport protein GutA